MSRRKKTNESEMQEQIYEAIIKDSSIENDLSTATTTFTTTITDDDNDNDDNKEIHVDLIQIRKKIRAYIRQNLITWLTNYFNPSHDWILISTDGSFMNYFDWVPKVFRKGPWNIFVCLYLFLIAYCISFFIIYHWFNNSEIQSSQQSNNEYEYYPIYSIQWYISCCGFAWTIFVTTSIAIQGSGIASLGTYTVQTWMLIVFRYGLSVIVPWVPSMVTLLEYLRLPMLAQSTITFITWNFMLAPLIFFHMETKAKKRAFIKVMTNFRMTQLHIIHMILATIHGIYLTPCRILTVQDDLCIAAIIALQYVLFYLFILDRLGIHLYLIFSPRTKLALLTWTITILSYSGCFLFWRYIIQQYGGCT